MTLRATMQVFHWKDCVRRAYLDLEKMHYVLNRLELKNTQPIISRISR